LSKGEHDRAVGVLKRAATENCREEIPEEMLANITIIKKGQEEVSPFNQ